MGSARLARIEAEYRETKMGAFDQTTIFDERGVEVDTYHSERSRSGRHGRDIWLLEPGRYWRLVEGWSNSGKDYSGFGHFEVADDGEALDLDEQDAPDWLFVLLPRALRLRLREAHDEK